MTSLFLNDKGVQLTQVNTEEFKQWLTSGTNKRFKTATQAIKVFLRECKGFIYGVNKISLTTYIKLKEVYNSK